MGSARLERDRDVAVLPAGVAYAARLLSAKREVAHAYAAADLDVGALIRLRERLGSSAKRSPMYEAFLVRAAALALRGGPAAVAQGATHVAVSMGGAPWEGSQAPVVRAADAKSVLKVSSELEDAVRLVRAGALRLEEQGGATFTVSCYMGADAPAVTVTEILEPPQLGVITLSAPRQRVSLSPSGPRVSELATATLTYNATLMDETEASALLKSCGNFLQNPQSLLI